MMSEHARIRTQQRNIPPLIVQWLLDHGTECHDNRGGVILHFDKHSRRQLEKLYGREITRRVRDLLDAYLVLQGSTVVTVGRRFERLPRH